MKHYFFILLTLVIVTSCQKKEEAIKPPNIIWLMAEDISLDLACYGTKGVKTPNLDTLAQEGMRFNNCFVTNPICSPSRSAMLLGVHQLKSNTYNHRSNREHPVTASLKPFTSLLRDAGYTCILGNSNVRDKGRKIDVNFKHEPIGTWDGIEHFGLFDKYDDFQPKDTPFFMQVELKTSHRGDWWEEVREQSTAPVSVDSIELPPYLADDPKIRLDWAKYLDQIEYVDYEVGLIIAELEEKGLLDNTVIIFMGDNGRANIRGKGYLYNAGIKVPLLMKWPKAKNKGITSDALITATDITATILDIAGIEVPEFMTGRSFISKEFNREEIYAARDLWDEIPEKSRAIVTKKWKYIRNDQPEIPWDAEQAYLEFYRPAIHIMRQMHSDSLLNEYQSRFFRSKKPREELYDLKNDPYELMNLANNKKYMKIIVEMRRICKKYDKEMTPVDSIFYPVHPISVDILNWIKHERPDEYQRMLSGEEIGFNRHVEKYNQLKN